MHTLISGVTNNDCTISFPKANDSGTTQKMNIITKWPEIFLDASTVFWTPQNKYTDCDMNPEAIAYAESLEKFQIMQKKIPTLVHTVHLPIPVQTNSSNIETHGRSFPRVKYPSGFANPKTVKHNLIIIRLTGVKYDLNATSTTIDDNYSSD